MTKMLSGGEELMNIFKKIKTRIQTGSKNFDYLFRIFQQRVELEEKFSSMIKGLIPADADKDDALLQSVLNELRQEAEIHTKFSQELRTKVVIPMDKENKHTKDVSKQILNDLKKTSTPVKKAIVDAQKAQKALEDANGLLNTLPAAKKDAQVKKMQKLTLELNQKVQKANQATDAIKGTTVPKIHQSFSKFDSDRLGQMQTFTVNFVANKKTYMNKVIEGCTSLNTRAIAMDGGYRSKKDVDSIFNASSTPRGARQGDGKDDNQPMRVVAISDYRSEEPDDLQFRRGDRIVVLLEHPSGWWEGELEGGKKGLFPRSYVEFEGAPRNTPIPIDAVFNVYTDFKNGQPQFLELLYGDLVMVDILQRDGFCRGINLRTGKKGIFPLNILEHNQ